MANSTVQRSAIGLVSQWQEVAWWIKYIGTELLLCPKTHYPTHESPLCSSSRPPACRFQHQHPSTQTRCPCPNHLSLSSLASTNWLCLWCSHPWFNPSWSLNENLTFYHIFKGELEAVFLLLISLFYSVDVADVDLNEIISATQHWKHHPTILQRKCVSWEIRLPFSCCTPFLLFCNETDFLIWSPSVK